MYVTREEYAQLGYDIVPSSAFLQFERMAETTVRRYTQNRISDSDLRPPSDADDDVKHTAMMNQCGVCEIMDLYYIANNPRSEAAESRQIVTNFHNDKYSESYLGNARSDVGIAAPDRMNISDVVQLYFTPDQLGRGLS